MSVLVRVLIVVCVLGALRWLTGHVRDRELQVVESAAAYQPRGVFHLAVNARDRGLTVIDDLAARAAGVGLSFLVITDVDNQLAGPLVRNGVAVVSFAESVTGRGSLVGLGGAYPLDDKQKSDPLPAMRAVGGVPVITRPTEPHHAWSGDISGAGGVELASVPATSRRLAGFSSFGLVPLILGAQWNPTLAAAQFFERDDAALLLWDRIPGDAVGICGGGAASGIDTTRDLTSWQLVGTTPLPEDIASKPSAVTSMLTRGSFHCTTGLFGDGVAFEFGARTGNVWVAREGDTVRDGDADEIVVVGPTVRIGEPRIVLFHDGVRVEAVTGRELHHRGLKVGVYRAEVHVEIPGLLFGSSQVPVVYSNRIRVVETFPPKRFAAPETESREGPWADTL